MKKQVNQYDKIFKENLEAIVPGLLQNILGIEVVASEELPDDIQHTKERKPDVLKKVTDRQGNTFVLQIEFQLSDEQEMVYRMAEYYIMLARKYKLSVRQYVLFLGDGMPKMPVKYQSELMSYQFPLVVFNKLDYRIFLRSSRPEEIILCILADLSGDNPERVLKDILQRIEDTTSGDFALKRHYTQLRILAQLRNLEDKLKDAMIEKISDYVSIERDAFYLVGKEIEQIKFVKYLLTQTDSSDEKIAEIVEVPIDFVLKVKQKLPSEK